MTTRREFLRDTAIVAAGLASGLNAKSYSRIIGANERVNFAVIGLHGRGYAHLESLAANRSNATISHVCDVDHRELDKFSVAVQNKTGRAPTRVQDFRKLLDSNDVDAVSIATPDHWHTPIAILALEAGKHVYVEKPCSHNPHEGELLVRAQKKYGRLVQMGNQQRSSPHTIEIINRIKNGLIGRPYFAKAWYANTRNSIGVGKIVPIPDDLDWQLWQGPAPRRPYKDNIHPYNWHWFWNWGTGEALNNGTHEVDVCRWALGVDFPKTVTSSGGRYHFNDDWEFYDTLVTSFEYDGKMISWEGLSCQGKRSYGRDRGAAIEGTEGTVIIDRSGYEVFSLEDKKIDEFKTENKSTTQDLTSADDMTDAHFRNFINGIRVGEQLHSPVEEASISVTTLLLSNIAWKMNRALTLDVRTGHILNDAKAMEMWGREYEKGWEPG